MYVSVKILAYKIGESFFRFIWLFRFFFLFLQQKSTTINN